MQSIFPENLSDQDNDQDGPGYYYLLPGSGQFVCSPSLSSYLKRGSSPGYEDFLSYIHPKDRGSLQKVFGDARLYKEFSIALRSNQNAGAENDVLINGTVMSDPMGARVIVGQVRLEPMVLPLENMPVIFEGVTNNAAAGLWLSDQSGQFIYLNRKMTDWIKVYSDSPDDSNWLNGLVEPDRTHSTHLYNEAISSGTHFETIFRVVKPDGSLAWYRAAGDPYYDKEARYQGFAGYCLDISDQTDAIREWKTSESSFRTLVEQAPVATCLFVGPELRIDIANESMIAMWGKTAEVIGLPLHVAVPELRGQPFLDLLKNVYETGKAHSARGEMAMIRVGDVLQEFYFDYTYKPIYDTDWDIYGIMDMAVDVTEQVRTTRQLRESEARFRSLILEAPFPTSVYRGRELIIEMANPEMITVWGKGNDVIGMPLHLALPELKTQPFLQILDDVYTSGKTYNTQESKVDLVMGGTLQTFYFNFTYKPLFDSTGNVYAIFNMAVDVTSQVIARHKLQFAEYNLRLAIELAELGTWDLDLLTGEMILSPRLSEWLGISPGSRCTVENILSTAIETERPNLRLFFTRLTDAPQKGISEIIFTVASGNQDAGRIIHSQARCLFNDDGKAYKVSGTSRDITTQKRTQHALEQQVQQRTEELQNVNEELTVTNEELYEINQRLTYSNEELAQYAYVASHDLQEPLRKIRMFSDILSKKQNLADDNQELVIKINKSAQRMSLLIENLLEFSRLLKSEKLFMPVDLNIVAAEVKSDFELMIVEKGAVITIGELPIVQGIGLQMNQLFYNLISNALKFSKPESTPVISITGQYLTNAAARNYISVPVQTSGYHHIKITDNGIGIDSQYSDQIFEVFKRLHRKEIYPGSGIGLALCRRIVTNHNGYIYLESVTGAGTVFHILLPATEE